MPESSRVDFQISNSSGVRPSADSDSACKMQLADIAPLGLIESRTQNRKLTKLEIWKNVWSIFGPILSIISFLSLCSHFWPEVSIIPGAVMNPNEAMDTQFIVTNSGAFGIYDLRFTCDIGGPLVAIKEIGGEDLKSVPYLPPTYSVSRACFTKADVSGNYLLRVNVEYKWPLVRRIKAKQAYFAVKKTASSFVLVPEAPPLWQFRPLIRVED